MPHPWEEKWTVGERLGKGGQGITYAVTFKADPSIHGALKHLKNNQDRQARGRKRREVANLQTLANQGGSVPRVLDQNTESFEDPGIELFVVMDLIPGSTLRDYVEKQGPLDIDAGVGLALSLCKTVKIAHSFPILHRDLKPENIIVRNDNPGDPVIVDYGLSFNALDEDVTQTSETFRNAFLDLPETNTPGGNRRDPRSDLAALAAVFYYCLTKHAVGQLQDGSGILPHHRPGYSLRDAIKGDSRISATEALLTRAFANIANRFQGVDELIAAFSALVAMSKVIDETDPIQLSAALSERIRLGDRKTQIAAFTQSANAIWNFLNRELQKYNGKLGVFHLGQAGFAPDTELRPTDGLDFVCRCPWGFSLAAEHHQELQFARYYLVGSRDDKCTLQALDYIARQARGLNLQKESSSDVCSYVGDPTSILNLAAMSFRDWVTQSMTKLAQAIVPA
jgi:serine/threonine protein kinase